jgi:hypothetical protein
MSDFKELEFETFDLSEEAEQTRLQEMLRNMNGVHMARITRNGVHIIYNPHGISPEEITNAVRQAGFTIAYEQPG